MSQTWISKTLLDQKLKIISDQQGLSLSNRATFVVWKFIISEILNLCRMSLETIFRTKEKSTLPLWTVTEIVVLLHTLSRSGVWIGMKVLGADSFILGTRKLWGIFLIKQKCHMTAAFLDNQNYSIFSSLDIFLPMCSRPGVQVNCTMEYQKNFRWF